MLGDGLTCHLQTAAQIAERLAVLGVKAIEQLPPTGISQGTKHRIVLHLKYGTIRFPIS
jgi:hypothetical protein